MRFKGLTAALFAIGLTFAASSAQALPLTGDTISGTFHFPNDGTVYGNFTYSVNPFVVGAGVESVLTVDGFAQTNVDFGPTSLVLTILNTVGYTGASFNGPGFAILAGSGFGSIANVLVSGGQSVAVGIVGGELQVNWQGASFNAGDTITVNFENGRVPEPATLLMLGAGLGAAALRRRLASRA
jgi:hypothetical protein